MWPAAAGDTGRSPPAAKTAQSGRTAPMRCSGTYRRPHCTHSGREPGRPSSCPAAVAQPWHYAPAGRGNGGDTGGRRPWRCVGRAAPA